MHTDERPMRKARVGPEWLSWSLPARASRAFPGPEINRNATARLVGGRGEPAAAVGRRAGAEGSERGLQRRCGACESADGG